MLRIKGSRSEEGGEEEGRGVECNRANVCK